VSRWSPERLLISIYPTRVVAARIEGGLRTRVVDKRIVEIDAVSATAAGGAGVQDSGGSANAGTRAWEPAIAALGRLVAELDAPHVPATVVVSSRFVRYAIVPWRDNVISAQEQQEFARHCMRGIYGDAASGWEIRLSSGGFRRNALACAADAAMLAEIEKTLADKSIPVVSIQPNFMTACNRFRRELRAQGDACVVVLEPGRVALGIFDKTGWRTLIARRVGRLSTQEVVSVVVQELKAASAEGLPDSLFVAAAGPTATSFFRTRTQDWLVPNRARLPEPVQ
jgi:hypothetical protein